MESESKTCGVCSILYDTNDRTPRVLINCGHTLCSHCLNKIIQTPSLLKCPFDSLAFNETQSSPDKFPLNFALLALLEGKKQNTCQTHDKKLAIFCLQDKVKICYDCALFGEHKGHSMKKVKELKAKGTKVKKDLEDGLIKFKKNQSEKDLDVETFKMELFSTVGSQFEEIKKALRTKELEWKKQIENLFEEKIGCQSGSLLRIEAEKALEEIDQACEKEENLALLDQDFSSIISRLQPQVTKEEISKVSDETSRMTDCFRSFLANQARELKDFDLLNERIKPEQPVLREKHLPENVIDTKQKFEFFNSLLNLRIQKNILVISAKNPNPINQTIDLDELNKTNKINIDLQGCDSLFQEDSGDLTALSEILKKLDNYTALRVLLQASGLTDHRTLHLFNLLFSRAQYLTQIEIYLEGKVMCNKGLLFFCTGILSKATSLKDLTIRLDSPLLTESLCVLAQSVSSFSRNWEALKLQIKDPSLTDDGIEKIFNVVEGVKELRLDLRGTKITDRSLKVLGSNPCMKNLKRFSFDVCRVKITMEGVNAIFTGIPKDMDELVLVFEGIDLPDEVISLFEEKVCPKLEVVETVDLRLEGKDLRGKVSKILETVRKEARKRRKALELKNKEKK